MNRTPIHRDEPKCSASIHLQAAPGNPELPGYALISGTYDAENIDENTRIFIETEGMLYEACPVGSALEERQTDACFTAYLPEDILKGRDFSVILCRDGKFYRNSCETIWE